MAQYGAQFHKNKKTIAETNKVRYGNYTCEICKQSPLFKGIGNTLDRAYEKQGLLLTIDHIVPLSKGGKNGLYNLQVCCNKCNMKKANK